APAASPRRARLECAAASRHSISARRNRQRRGVINCRGCDARGGTAPFELVRVALVSFILFLSGCSALLFQNLCLRLSGIAFGNSIWYAAMFLSRFLSGTVLVGSLSKTCYYVEHH